jgi:hypothetical protein
MRTTIQRLFLAMFLALTVAVGVGAASGSAAASQGYTTEYYWQEGPGTFTALYKFRSDGVGLRTTYPTGTLAYGLSFAFAWRVTDEGVVVMQYVSGYTDTFTGTYDEDDDTIYQRGSRQGPAPLYGCGSGMMPSVIYHSVC